jgi:ribulose 1,5-bisphosphate carboxylase large subunit-like protein
MPDVIVSYYFRPRKDTTPEQAAQAISGEEATGTWTGIAIQAGGGVHGHPDGTAAGARAIRQAVDAYMEGKSAEEYAEDHYELERALKKWGTA